ncbi:ZBT22 protein, partial [Polyodon spathula]|nr:zinc finger and BTB domain-containing protein 9-like [Polyodon spathula]MBN3283426.1 ZBT22 protein [Polyodon spathula]
MALDQFELHLDFPQYSASLLSQLNQHRLGGHFCDVTVQSCDGGMFRAHTAVLAAASRYFHDQFLLRAGKGEELVLVLPEAVETGVFERVLDCAYTGSLRIVLESTEPRGVASPSIAAKLGAYLTAASFLQMWHVVDRCNELLLKAGGADTAAAAAAAAADTAVGSAQQAAPGSFRSPPSRSENQSPSSSTSNAHPPRRRASRGIGESHWDRLQGDATQGMDTQEDNCCSSFASGDSVVDVSHIKVELLEEKLFGEVADGMSVVSDTNPVPPPLPANSLSNIPDAPTLEQLQGISAVGGRGLTQLPQTAPRHHGPGQQEPVCGISVSSVQSSPPQIQSPSLQGLSSLHTHHQGLIAAHANANHSVGTLACSLPEFLAPTTLVSDNACPNSSSGVVYGAGSNDPPSLLAPGSLLYSKASNAVTLQTSAKAHPSTPSVLHAQVDRISRFGKRVFGCLCGKRFPERGRRDRHVLLKLSARPFGCPQCNKSFKLKHHLTEHMIVHMERPLYSCETCGKTFKMIECFQRHRENCLQRGRQ